MGPAVRNVAPLASSVDHRCSCAQECQFDHKKLCVNRSVIISLVPLIIFVKYK